MASMETLGEIDRQIALLQERIEYQIDDIQEGVSSAGADARISCWTAELAALKSKRRTMTITHSGYLY